jgi:hypothetical protein
MFELVQMYSQHMNKISIEMNYHLTTENNKHKKRKIVSLRWPFRLLMLLNP